MDNLIFNDGVAFSLYLKAKDGDKQKQTELLKLLIIETKTIRYQYLNRAKKVGLSLEDLEDDVVHALYILFAKKLDVIKENTFLSFFKYIYLRTIQQNIRNKFRKREITLTDYLSIKDDPFFQTDRLIIFADSEEKEQTHFIENEMTHKFVYENACDLSRDEQDVMILFINGYNLFEQAKRLKIPNSTIYNRFNSGLKKIRNYIIKNKIFELDCIGNIVHQ